MVGKMRGCLLLLAAALAVASGCTHDTDCWMNGVCRDGQCHCSKGWKGEDCSKLNLLPTPPGGAYGYSPNVSAWGGGPIKVDGKWHMHVAEMVNGCGLTSWTTNSRVVHAIADNMTGPYTFHDVSVRDWAHNPAIAVDKSGPKPKYILMHIGNGHPKNATVCTHETPDPPPAANTSNIMHVSDSPYGPWEPAAPVPFMYNPSPYIFPNGTTIITGYGWRVYRGDSWNGPFTEYNIKWSGDGGPGDWEDPCIWYDPTMKVYKMVSHVYLTAPDWPYCKYNYTTRVAGFAYSYDAVNWVKSPKEPFDSTVPRTDGTVTIVNTRERPKMIFDDDGHTPIGLANGVNDYPLPWGCKNAKGRDWSYNIVVPIGD